MKIVNYELYRMAGEIGLITYLVDDEDVYIVEAPHQTYGYLVSQVLIHLLERTKGEE